MFRNVDWIQDTRTYILGNWDKNSLKIINSLSVAISLKIFKKGQDIIEYLEVVIKKTKYHSWINI